MSPCHSRARAGVSQAWRWQHFHSFSGLVWGEWAITAGFGKGNGNTGGEAALGWGMGLAVPSLGTKPHKPALQWQQGGRAPVSIRGSVPPLSLKHPGCGAAAGCCPGPERHRPGLPRCACPRARTLFAWQFSAQHRSPFAAKGRGRGQRGLSGQPRAPRAPGVGAEGGRVPRNLLLPPPRARGTVHIRPNLNPRGFLMEMFSV